MPRLMIGLAETQSTKALSGCVVLQTIVVRKKKMIPWGMTALGIMKQSSREKQMEKASDWIWNESWVGQSF